MKPLACLALTFLLLAPAVNARAGCIVDDTGTRVCLDRAPRRAVSLYGAFTELLAALGGAESLVARTQNDDTVPEVAKLPSVGTGLRPNVELLLALKPDVVVSRSSKAAAEALGALRARGLQVAAFDPTGLDELYGTIDRLGVLWGRPGEAKALTERIRAGMARVEKKTAGVPRRLRVVYEVRAEPLTVAGSGGLVDELLGAAGAENAVKIPKKLVQLDPEALLKLDPDAYVLQVGPMNPKPLPPAERPHLQTLRAVREGRILSVEEELFARPGPHVADAAERLSRALYPDLWSSKASGPASSGKGVPAGTRKAKP
ncbi:MAG: ABC transporter substrate-binding protein [Deltaproteobacteria bacterium]|nr:ABC transporter substrate-binding protein [Deltaproteobacteria bacterium]